ncbi:MAG: Asp-tRNA(Asn)/Glu-tRNA(Gln) amidotransferase subunit GatA [bacterium]|nr:Asp-tRNA(Asn)/Glu-tRNA(Gln) amidotransferase subunit GatA [bacterium]
MDLKNLTIKSVREGIEKGEFSAHELHKKFLKLIEEEDKSLHSYLSLNETVTKEDRPEGILGGVPLALKDNMSLQGSVTTAASKILKNHVAVYDATVVRKLKEAGAVILGKTNLDEFAMGSSTENSAFGVTKNPHDHSRVPGGSSGGSAAAVAAGLAVAALGSDTGGSIRQPAAFCGIVGLKPTYGRVSRYGLLALASSLDQIGPMTKNIYDAALLMNILSGADPMDSTAAQLPVPDFTANLSKPIKGLKIAMPKEYFGEGLDGEVNKVVEQAISKLEQLGAHVDQVSLPHTKYSLATYYILMPAEASSNLARYDGIRYGLYKKGEDLLDGYLQSRSEGFGDEVRRRIVLGTYTLSSGYYDAYYLRAQKVRTLITNDFEKVFEKFDVIVGPTTPTTAFKIGEKEDPLSMYLSDIYTVPVNLAGLPALSMPCGAVNGLPVGLQIIGKKFDEEKILQVGYNLENI